MNSCYENILICRISSNSDKNPKAGWIYNSNNTMESEPSKHTDYFWVLKPNNDNYYNVTVISKNGDTSFTTLAIGEWVLALSYFYPLMSKL